jgi:hypothetical protein
VIFQGLIVNIFIMNEIVDSVSVLSIKRDVSLLENYIDEIIDGFKSPYAMIALRKRLFKLLHSIINDSSAWITDFHFPVDVIDESKLILSELTPNLLKSQTCFTVGSKRRIVHFLTSVKPLVLDSISDKALSKLRHPRIMTTDKVISETVPSSVNFSVSYKPDKSTILYVDNANIVDDLCTSINDKLRKLSVSGQVTVTFVPGGSLLSNLKIESRANFLTSGRPIVDYQPSDVPFIASGTIGAIVSLTEDETEVSCLGFITAGHVCSSSIFPNYGQIFYDARDHNDIAVTKLDDNWLQSEMCTNSVSLQELEMGEDEDEVRDSIVSELSDMTESTHITVMGNEPISCLIEIVHLEYCLHELMY